VEQTPPDILFTQRDDHYLRQLREEEAFWDEHEQTLSSRPPPPTLQSYLNERMTGDPNREWFETIEDYGDFQRGCVLGAGPGFVETHLLAKHPKLHLTILDISRGALQRFHDRLERDFPGRSETQQVDLNFVEFPADTYDLVVARSTMHHMLNLEHLAFQTNRSLTADGRFFMQDVVCESRLQFSEEKKRLFEMFMDATRDSYQPRPEFRWPDRDNSAFSPFECARSEEILEIFGRYLEEVSVQTAGALTTSQLWVERLGFQPPSESSRMRALAREVRRTASRLRQMMLGQRLDVALARSRENLLFSIDRIVSETGFLKPFLAFAIYRRRAGPAGPGVSEAEPR
jgi:SAM-dependent methyltransferase